MIVLAGLAVILVLWWWYGRQLEQLDKKNAPSAALGS